MFKVIRGLLDALNGITLAIIGVGHRLEAITKAYDKAGPLVDRLEALERSREQWEAVTEAQLVRGETAFKTARAAEERAKTVLKNAEALRGSDEGEEGFGTGELGEYLELLRANAGAGEVEGVPPVPAGVAVSGNSAALNAKFGRAI